MNTHNGCCPLVLGCVALVAACATETPNEPLSTGGTVTAAGGRAPAGDQGITSGGTASSGDGGSCPHAVMHGNNFLTIGDSWIQIPGTQVSHLEDYLKAAGVIGSSEHFERREQSGTPISTIIGRYSGGNNANVTVLIMDGGGIDLFSTAAGDQAAIAPVVQKFKDFLQQLKSDGYVQHVIYSLYPVIPSTPNLNQNMKPGFTDACNNGPVDCHLVDLEPLFQGQHFAGDRTHPDETGAQLIAQAWWQAMQRNCIAQ